MGSTAELALTLLRATGYLSRSQLSMRPEPGRVRSTRSKGRSCSGRRTFEYALLPHRGDWRDADLHDAADEVLVPLERVRAGGVARRATRAHRGTVAGGRRRVVGGAARAGRIAGPRVQPVPRRPSTASRAGRRAGDRLDGRPARPPHGAVRGRGRARGRGRSRRSGSTAPDQLKPPASPRRARAGAREQRLPLWLRGRPGAVEAGRASRIRPASHSHSSAGRAPCQRTAYEMRPGAGRRVVHFEALAAPLGGELDEQRGSSLRRWRSRRRRRGGHGPPRARAPGRPAT